MASYVDHRSWSACFFYRSFKFFLYSRTNLCHFTLINALEFTFWEFFINIINSSTGVLPAKCYYLYKKEIDVGTEVSIVTLEQVFYKVGIPVWRTVNSICKVV